MYWLIIHLIIHLVIHLFSNNHPIINLHHSLHSFFSAHSLEKETGRVFQSYGYWKWQADCLQLVFWVEFCHGLNVCVPLKNCMLKLCLHSGIGLEVETLRGKQDYTRLRSWLRCRVLMNAICALIRITREFVSAQLCEATAISWQSATCKRVFTRKSPILPPWSWTSNLQLWEVNILLTTPLMTFAVAAQADIATNPQGQRFTPSVTSLPPPPNPTSTIIMWSRVD